MFEATLEQGKLLKQILEAIKELVTEANLECTPSGISLQAMDSSHVSLGFTPYRCDRNISLGINMTSLAKILKCASNEDSIKMKCNDEADSVSFIFENSDKDKISEFSLKLMDIEAETLGIPEQEYKAVVHMPAAEFQRICRDLAALGDTVSINVTKEGITFSAQGDIGQGQITVKQSCTVDKDEEASTNIELQEPVSLNFALRYLSTFTKATTLSSLVKLSMAKDVPLAVEFKIAELGYIRYYLAPKIDDENE